MAFTEKQEPKTYEVGYLLHGREGRRTYRVVKPHTALNSLRNALLSAGKITHRDQVRITYLTRLDGGQ